MVAQRPSPGRRGVSLCSGVGGGRPIAVKEYNYKACSYIVCSLTCSSCVDKHIDVHIIFVIIHPQYVFAFVERPCSPKVLLVQVGVG